MSSTRKYKVNMVGNETASKKEVRQIFAKVIDILSRKKNKDSDDGSDSVLKDDSQKDTCQQKTNGH